MVWDPCDKQQHHHWAPDIIMKHNIKGLLLPQDCNWVASGALFACTLWVCPSFHLQLLFTAELLQAQPFGRASVFIFHPLLPWMLLQLLVPFHRKLGQLNLRSIFSS